MADLGLLAQLTSAANDTDVPERLLHLMAQPHGERPGPLQEPAPPFEQELTTADHFEAFLNSMGFTGGDVRRAMLAKQIADVIKTQDRHETAEDLLRRFDPPASFTPNVGEPSASAHSAPDGTPEAPPSERKTDGQ